MRKSLGGIATAVIIALVVIDCLYARYGSLPVMSALSIT